MAIIHVSYDFLRLSDGELPGFAGGVFGKVYTLPAFTGAPGTAVSSAATLKTYTDLLAAMADAGPSVTAEKNIAKAAVIALLRDLAAFVEKASANNLSTLLSSGFHAASKNRASEPLGQAVIGQIDFAGPGNLLVISNVLDHAHSWEAQWKPENSPDSAYQHCTNLKPARKMTIINLPSLTRVTIQTRGQGGSTGYGPWSDGVTHPVL